MSEPIFSKDQLYSSQGHKRSRSLFVETAVQGDNPIMTLSIHEKDGLFNLRSYFIALVTEDPTEVLFAETVFGDVAFWENIAEKNWMKPYITEWRHISDVKRKEKAFSVLINEVKTNGKLAVNAAKYLIEEPWKNKRKPAVKKQVIKSAEEAGSKVKEDFVRLQEYL